MGDMFHQLLANLALCRVRYAVPDFVQIGPFLGISDPKH